MPTMGLSDLASVAQRLTALNERFAFVGGCVLPLLLDEAFRPTARITFDVDVVVSVISRTAEASLDERLRTLGFRHDTRPGAPRCRWLLGDATVDIMAQGPGLEFSTQWLNEGLMSAINCQLSPNVHALVLTAPYFISAKLQAFKSRGSPKGRPDFHGSKDLEDVIALIEGRAALVSELEQAPSHLRGYVSKEIAHLLSDPAFIDAIPAHLSDLTSGMRHAAKSRVESILQCISQM